MWDFPAHSGASFFFFSIYLWLTWSLVDGWKTEKCWNRPNDERKDLRVICISDLLDGFKKKGDRGQLNMHMIWGYAQSLGFKLLDERRLWINVIFSLTFGHLLRATEKSLYALSLLMFFINVPWEIPEEHLNVKWLNNFTDFTYLFPQFNTFSCLLVWLLAGLLKKMKLGAEELGGTAQWFAIREQIHELLK